MRSLLKQILTDADNMTQSKLSELTGVSETYLSKIARGKADPSITTCWKIAIALNCKIEDIWPNPGD